MTKKMRRPTVKHHNPLNQAFENMPNANSSKEMSPVNSDTDGLPLMKTAHNIIHYYVKQKDDVDVERPMIKK